MRAILARVKNLRRRYTIRMVRESCLVSRELSPDLAAQARGWAEPGRRDSGLCVVVVRVDPTEVERMPER